MMSAKDGRRQGLEVQAVRASGGYGNQNKRGGREPDDK